MDSTPLHLEMNTWASLQLSETGKIALYLWSNQHARKHERWAQRSLPKTSCFNSDQRTSQNKLHLWSTRRFRNHLVQPHSDSCTVLLIHLLVERRTCYLRRPWRTIISRWRWQKCDSRSCSCLTTQKHVATLNTSSWTMAWHWKHINSVAHCNRPLK